MNNVDWIEKWKNESQNYKQRVDNHTKLIKENASNDKKKRSESKLSIKPKLMYPTFYRIPKEMKKVIRKNSKSFTPTEYVMLDWILDEVLSFHWWEHKYQPKVIMDSCDIREDPFYKNLKKLIDKNIIRVQDTTKEDRSKNIYTSKKLILNPFWDTWNIKNMKTGILQDDNQNSIQDEVYTDEEMKADLEELRE